MDVVEDVLLEQDAFEEMQYFLTSSFRVELLLQLYESDKTTKHLKQILNKSESNVLHYLKDFEEKEFVERNKEFYSLTSKGYFIIRHIIKLINNWDTINKNKYFLDSHQYDNLPLKFIINMDLWNKAELVVNDNLDYNKPSHVYSDLISQSKYLKVILPVLSSYHLDALLTSLEENEGTLDLITSNILLKSIYASEFHERFFKLRGKGKIKIKTIKRGTHSSKFLTCTENFSSLYLIYDNGIYDDSMMLLTQDEDDVHKLNKLFDIYNETLESQ